MCHDGWHLALMLLYIFILYMQCYLIVHVFVWLVKEELSAPKISLNHMSESVIRFLVLACLWCSRKSRGLHAAVPGPLRLQEERSHIRVFLPVCELGRGGRGDVTITLYPPGPSRCLVFPAGEGKWPKRPSGLLQHPRRRQDRVQASTQC